MTQLLGVGFGTLHTRVPVFGTAAANGVGVTSATGSGGSGAWPDPALSGVVLSERWTGTYQGEQAAHLMTQDTGPASGDVSWERTAIGSRGAVHRVNDPEGVFSGAVRNTCIMFERYGVSGVSGSFVEGDHVEFRDGSNNLTSEGCYIQTVSSEMDFWIWEGEARPNASDTITNLDRTGSATLGALNTTTALGPGNYGSFSLGTPLDNVWARYFIRFSPGWTSAGPRPTGHANSRKLVFLTWSGAGNRLEIEYSNTNSRIHGMSQTGVSISEAFINETAPGTGTLGSQATFGEWSDGDWREIVAHYNRLSSTTGQWGLFWRKVTVNGQWVAQTWAEARQYCIDQGGNYQNATQNLYDFQCATCDITATSGTLAQVAGGNTNANRNKHGHANEFYEYYAGFDVINGAVNSDPFGLGSLL